LNLLWGTYAINGDTVVSGCISFIAIALIELYRTLPNTVFYKLVALVASFIILAIFISVLWGGKIIWGSNVLIALIIGRYSSIFGSKYATYVDALLP